MSKSRAKGTAFETAVCGFLREHGFPYAERRALRGKRDGGDLTGMPGVTIECKAEKELNLAGAVDEAEKEAANMSSEWFVAVLKRRMRGVDRAYAVTTLEQYAALLVAAEAGWMAPREKRA